MAWRQSKFFDRRYSRCNLLAAYFLGVGMGVWIALAILIY